MVVKAVTVTGVKALVKALKKADAKMVGATGAAITREGYSIQAEGMEITPEDVGILRRSWYVAPPKIKDRNPVVEVGVGTKYALAVHERPAYHTPPTQWKYLITPVNKALDGYMARVASNTRKYYKRGIGIKGLPKTAPARPSKESEGK